MSTDSLGDRDNDLLQRIRGEYLEMPGLRLTHRQAQRLWALDAAMCRHALDMLVESGFLRRTDDDCFVRKTEGSTVTAGMTRRLTLAGRGNFPSHADVSRR